MDNVGEILDQIGWRIHLSTDRGKLRTELDNVYSSLIVSADWWFLYEETSFSTVEDQEEYELSSSILDSQNVTRKILFMREQTADNFIEPIGTAELYRAMADPSGSSGYPLCVRYSGYNKASNTISIKFWPIPSSAITIYLGHYFRPVKFSSDAIAPELPPEWRYLLVEGTSVGGFQHKGQEQNALISRGVFDEGVKKLQTLNTITHMQIHQRIADSTKSGHPRRQPWPENFEA